MTMDIFNTIFKIRVLRVPIQKRKETVQDKLDDLSNQYWFFIHNYYFILYTSFSKISIRKM